MPPQDERDAIVSNAARLLRDAKLLVDNERYASAFALSVLALEEIGKVVLGLWDVSQTGKPHSSHQRKQAAVSALLLARHTTKELGNLITSEPVVTEELVERVARAMRDSEAGRFDWVVSIGAVDRTKQLAFYRDDWLDAAGLHADQFKSADVTHLFEKCRAAIEALSDLRTMHVGKAIWHQRASFRSRK